MKFKCWEPGSQGEATASEYEAEGADDAAELYAESIHPYSDGGANLDIDVRDEAGTHFEFTVEVDYDPIFTAGKRRGACPPT